MPTKRICQRHRLLYPAGEKCPQCVPEFAAAERRRNRLRGTTEPWRKLYATTAWRRARAKVLARDGHRCRAAESGIRCDNTHRLSVHHLVPVQDTWRDAAGDVEAFVLAATDVEQLVTACPLHHNQLDSIRRGAL